MNRFLARNAVLLLGSGLALVILAGCTYVPPEESSGDYYEDDYGPEFPPDGEFAELWHWGTWLAMEPYGWVWQPDVVDSWAPYRHGHWILSQWGWTWLSYEPFGWATYHYGYWFYDVIWGWLWAPDYVWYPANVQWIVDYDYVAWTPATPGIGGVREPWMTHTPEVWTVVPVTHFTQLDVGRFGRSARKMKPSSGDPGTREAPSLSLIERTVGRKIYPIDVELSPVKSGSREFQRMKLYGEQRRTVERFSPQVEKRVMNPRSYSTRPYDKKARKKNTRTPPPDPDTKKKDGNSAGKNTDEKTKDKK